MAQKGSDSCRLGPEGEGHQRKGAPTPTKAKEKEISGMKLPQLQQGLTLLIHLQTKPQAQPRNSKENRLLLRSRHSLLQGDPRPLHERLCQNGDTDESYRGFTAGKDSAREFSDSRVSDGNTACARVSFEYCKCLGGHISNILERRLVQGCQDTSVFSIIMLE